MSDWTIEKARGVLRSRKEGVVGPWIELQALEWALDRLEEREARVRELEGNKHELMRMLAEWYEGYGERTRPLCCRKLLHYTACNCLVCRTEFVAKELYGDG